MVVVFVDSGALFETVTKGHKIVSVAAPFTEFIDFLRWSFLDFSIQIYSKYTIVPSGNL